MKTPPRVSQGLSLFVGAAALSACALRDAPFDPVDAGDDRASTDVAPVDVVAPSDVAEDFTPDVSVDVAEDFTPDVRVDVAEDSTPDIATDVVVDATPCGLLGASCCATDASATGCASGLMCEVGACACPTGTSVCGGVCVDTRVNVSHCGACETVCAMRAHAVPTCVASVCVTACEPGFGDCDSAADNGCESPLDTAMHCGACAVSCATGQSCVSGACVPTPQPGCTGGTISELTLDRVRYRVHTFTMMGPSMLMCDGPSNVEYLVIGGGGGGGDGRAGGGGGAGGYLTGMLTLPMGMTRVSVGNGGGRSTNGMPSSLATVTAMGGGAGGNGEGANPGRAGGSGGGGGFKNTAGGAGTPGQGNNGGTSRGGNYIAGGGGGGAGAVGTTGTGSGGGVGGNGGAGLMSSITGTAVMRAGGGAGNGESGDGTAGAGGGGAVNSAGQPNTGGGGGGNAAGGSGVVIVRYVF